MRVHVKDCPKPALWRVVHKGTDTRVDAAIVAADDREGWVELAGMKRIAVAGGIEIQKFSDGAWQRVTEIPRQPERARDEAVDGRIQLEASRQQGDLLVRASSFPESFRPSPMMTGPTLMKAVIAYIDHLEAELSTARSLLDQQDEVEVTSIRELVHGSADVKDNILVERDHVGIWVAALLQPNERIIVDQGGGVRRAQALAIETFARGGEVRAEPAGMPIVGSFSEACRAAGQGFLKFGELFAGPLRYDDVAAAEFERQNLLEAFVGPDEAKRMLATELRPAVYGTVKNVEPPLKGHSGETFSFEQALKSVDAVYVDGVPLKRGENHPCWLKSDEYRVHLDRGDIILGSKPKGRVTADVTGFENEAERGRVRLYGRSSLADVKVPTVEEISDRLLYRAPHSQYEVVPMGSTEPIVFSDRGFDGLKPVSGEITMVVGGERGFGKSAKVEAEFARAKAGGATVVRLGGPKVHKPWPGALTGELMSSHDVAKLGEPDEA